MRDGIGAAVAALFTAGVLASAAGAVGLAVGALPGPGGETGTVAGLTVGAGALAVMALGWRRLAGGGGRAAAVTFAALLTGGGVFTLTIAPLTEMGARAWCRPGPKFCELDVLFGIATYGAGGFLVVGALPWLVGLAVCRPRATDGG